MGNIQSSSSPNIGSDIDTDNIEPCRIMEMRRLFFVKRIIKYGNTLEEAFNNLISECMTKGYDPPKPIPNPNIIYEKEKTSFYCGYIYNKYGQPRLNQIFTGFDPEKLKYAAFIHYDYSPSCC